MSTLYQNLQHFTGTETYRFCRYGREPIALTEAMAFLLETPGAAEVLRQFCALFAHALDRQDRFIALTYARATEGEDCAHIHDGNGHTYRRLTLPFELPLDPGEEIRLYAVHDSSCWVVMLAREY